MATAWRSIEGRRQQLPLGILFDELNALVLREIGTSLDAPVPHKMRDDGLDLVHTDATNGWHSQYFPCQYDSSVCDHQPSDYAVRSLPRSPNLLCSQDHSLLRKNVSYHCWDDCLACEQDNFVISWPFSQSFFWVIIFIYSHPNLDV